MGGLESLPAILYGSGTHSPEKRSKCFAPFVRINKFITSEFGAKFPWKNEKAPSGDSFGKSRVFPECVTFPYNVAAVGCSFKAPCTVITDCAYEIAAQSFGAEN